MSTAKDIVRKLLNEIPDDASLEDIQYHIYVREKIERGLGDVKAGTVIRHVTRKSLVNKSPRGLFEILSNQNQAVDASLLL